MRQRIIAASVVMLAAIAIAGCNSAASPSGAASAAASAAPSQLIPSLEVPSGLASAIPSFALPSPDPALEALLPDQLCGTAAIKSSAAGGAFAAGNTQIQRFLAALGKTSSDLSFASELAGTTGCGATIVKINGATQSQLHDQFIASATQGGAAPTEQTIGGKSVLVGPDPASFGYVYFKDDMVIFFSAPDPAKAAEVATALP